MQKQQEYMKATTMKQIIKSQQVDAKQKKVQDLQEKQNRARQQVEEKMLREEQTRLEHEAMVARMEQEELELIQRLQNTQLLQKAAYEDLETALTGQGVQNQAESRPQTSNQKVKPARQPSKR